MPASVRLVDPAENEYLSDLEVRARRENHFFRVMANRADVLEKFVPLYSAIMGQGSIDRRTKELAYVAVSYANECAYCLSLHMAGGRKAGITEDELRNLQLEQNQGFTPQEKAVLQYARDLTRTASADDTREALAEYFTDEQIVELTLVVAMANFTNRFNNGLGLQPES